MASAQAQGADIATLLSESMEQGGLLLTRDRISPELLDLSSGLAGELFQKFVSYQQKLALVIPDLVQQNERVQELASEHNRHPQVRIFLCEQQAREWLNE